MVRSLFCALLAVLVAMVVAPEPLAHAAVHVGKHSTAANLEHPCAGHAENKASHDKHAPGKPCGDCCHHATCHMKMAPAGQDWSPAFSLQTVRFRSGDFVAPYGAPTDREPDPERS